MLVLSRKESDRILFPTLGITIELLRIQGTSARIGIDAPADVPILRHEIADLKSLEFTSQQETAQQLRGLLQAVRARAEDAAEQLNLLHRHAEESGDAAAQQLILQVYRQLRELDRDTNTVMDAQAKQAARVLLVEDDENERQLLASYLQLRGIETTTAIDGQDALEFLSLHAAPDVILLDMHMPRCDGPRFVQQLRADNSMRGVKLIAVSGTDPHSLGIPTGDQGVDRWVIKPIDPERLIDGISAELGIPTTAV